MSETSAPSESKTKDPEPVAPDPSVQAAADALMTQAHIRANFAAKAFVEALNGVGENGRILTARGLATVSDVRAHGPLVIIDGFIEGKEPFRKVVHPSDLDLTIVIPQGVEAPADADTDG